LDEPVIKLARFVDEKVSSPVDASVKKVPAEKPAPVNVYVNESALALGAAKHKAKARHTTAPKILNGLSIPNPFKKPDLPGGSQWRGLYTFQP
jgi:hypothetical protein